MSEDYRCKIIPVIYLAQQIWKTRHFLHRVIRPDAMDHNEIDTVHPVWAETFEQIKINRQFFRLGTCCRSLMWFETKSTAIRKCFINFAIHHLFYTLFKKLSIQKLLEWLLVAMIVSSLFNNKNNCQNMSERGCWNWSYQDCPRSRNRKVLKNKQKEFPTKHLSKYIVTCLYATYCTPNQIHKVHSAHCRKNLNFIFYCSEFT